MTKLTIPEFALAVLIGTSGSGKVSKVIVYGVELEFMYQFDFDPANLPEDIYFFSPQSREVIAGNYSYLDKMTPTRSLRWAILVFVFSGLPVAILGIVLAPLLNIHPIVPLVSVALICAYIGYQGHVMARKMHSEGRITIGYITGYSTTIVTNSKGYRRGIKAFYRFQTRDGEEVKGSRAIRLKGDERENPLPVENTPVPILYINSKWHTFL